MPNPIPGHPDIATLTLWTKNRSHAEHSQSQRYTAEAGVEGSSGCEVMPQISYRPSKGLSAASTKKHNTGDAAKWVRSKPGQT